MKISTYYVKAETYSRGNNQYATQVLSIENPACLSDIGNSVRFAAKLVKQNFPFTKSVESAHFQPMFAINTERYKAFEKAASNARIKSPYLQQHLQQQQRLT